MRRTGVWAAAVAVAVLGAGAAGAAETPAGEEHAPGRGLTASFEVEYLKFIVNHHFAALRMTELAAGTDDNRRADIKDSEGTAPTPGFEATPPKAPSKELRSLARRNNRMQREEILEAQDFLRKWYGIDYQPQLSESSRRAIEHLERAEGAHFDQDFIEIFSRHHFMAVGPSTECQVASDVKHPSLRRYCRGIVESQLGDIMAMRHLYCERYGVCDYQPLGGMQGRKSMEPRQ